MQELEFVTMMVIMISCAMSSYRLGKKEGIHNAIEFFEEEGLIELEDKDWDDRTYVPTTVQTWANKKKERKVA